VDVQVTFNSFFAFGEETNREIRTVAKETAGEVLAEARRLMQEPKSGKVHKRKGRIHRASAPGEAPAIDTQELYDSGKVDDSRPMDVSIVFTAPHAEELEIGSSRIKPRPYLEPATKAVSSKYTDAVGDAVSRAARRVGK
jgi:hypothetical protein